MRLRRRMYSALVGRWRGGTSGRSSLVDCGVRLIFEGLATSRPGVRRGSLSRSGRGQRVLAAHSADAGLARRCWAFLGARARPGNVPGARVWGFSVKGCGLPEERGELASARDRDDAGWLAAVAVQVLPAGVEALLGAPGDLDHTWVLTRLPVSERVADQWRVSGRGTTSARCPCGSFSDAALPNPA